LVTLQFCAKAKKLLAVIKVTMSMTMIAPILLKNIVSGETQMWVPSEISHLLTKGLVFNQVTLADAVERITALKRDCLRCCIPLARTSHKQLTAGRQSNTAPSSCLLVGGI
jgi:hypothetical protein